MVYRLYWWENYSNKKINAWLNKGLQTHRGFKTQCLHVGEFQSLNALNKIHECYTQFRIKTTFKDSFKKKKKKKKKKKSKKIYKCNRNAIERLSDNLDMKSMVVQFLDNDPEVHWHIWFKRRMSQCFDIVSPVKGVSYLSLLIASNLVS